MEMIAADAMSLDIQNFFFGSQYQKDRIEDGADKDLN